MPGHNGLFARQLPIALSYFEYVDISGFNETVHKTEAKPDGQKRTFITHRREYIKGAD
jgi:hypothetical protein